MKMQISMNDELAKRVDDYADENYMSRSGFISLACANYLNAHEATKAVQEVAACMRKIADTGKVDHDAMEQLEAFEEFAKMINSSR